MKKVAMPKAKKVVLDTRAAMVDQLESAQRNARDKFARAGEVLSRQPHGLALVGDAAPSDREEAPARPMAPGEGGASAANAQPPFALQAHRSVAFDPETATLGSIVRAPLGLIDANPLSPRRIYNSQTVDKIVATFTNGQDDAAHGYLEGGRIKLIDGGTRLQAAKNTSTDHLDVKIEAKPKDKLHLFLRARELNENRNAVNALDFALSLQALLDQGAVDSQRDLVEHVAAPNGGKMSESTVSRYLRISRLLPESVQRRMIEAEETSTYAALFAVSEMFSENLSETEQEARTEMAEEVVDEIKRKKLSRPQIQQLVKSKLDGPKTRERSSVHPLEFPGHKGHIKLFARQGKLDLSLQGLSEESLPKLRETLEAALKQFLSPA